MKTAAKISIIAITLGLYTLTGCDNIEVERAQNKKEAQVMRDSFDRLFTETLHEINTNLEVINEKEGVIMLGPDSPVEKNISDKERVLRNIHLINTLIEDSREKMAKLDQQVKEYASQTELAGKQTKEYKQKTQKLEKLLASTEERLKTYEDELASLKNELMARDFHVVELNEKLGAYETKNQMLKEYSDKYEKVAFTGYYTCGNYKQLKSQGVVQKKGPIRRLTGDPKLVQSLPQRSFTPIDIRTTTSIPVDAKKVKLVTSHSAKAYELKKTGNKVTSIEIIDPEEFWKTSKYLVVETH